MVLPINLAPILINISALLYMTEYYHVFLLCCRTHEISYTAVSSEAWAKLRDWASVAGRGRLLLSGSVAHASLKTAV